MVEENKVVTIEFTLTNSDGTVLETTEGDAPFDFLQGAMEILPPLEAALEGKKIGDELSITLSPEEAYGERNEELVDVVDLEEFGPEGVEVGEELQIPLDDEFVTVEVTDITDGKVTCDMNHPLAGMTLTFVIKVIAVRDATAEELEHGHAHSADGCC